MSDSRWFPFKSPMKNIKGLLNYIIVKPSKWLLNMILDFLDWLLDKLPMILGFTFAGGFCLFCLLCIICGIRGCYLDNKTEKELDIMEVEIVHYNNENGDKCVYTNFNADNTVINDKGMAIIYTTNTFGIKSELRSEKYCNRLILPNYVIERKWIKKNEGK